MKLVDRGLLGILIVIFLASSLDKIFHYEGFVNALRNYVLVPRGVAASLAPVVILVELFIAAGLLLRAWRRPAALTAAVTLLVFTAAIGLNYLYGSRGICGCWFTFTLAESTGLHLVQNLLLFTVAVVIWRGEPPADSALPPATTETPA